MSDYSLQATWDTKDALVGGSALKAISATELGTEFSAIATAVATKYDADDVASTAEAQALTLNNVLITPGNLDDVLTHNAGILKDLFSLTVAGFSAADAIFGWDDSAAAAIGFTATNGLETSGTNLQIASSAAGNGLGYSTGVLSVNCSEGVEISGDNVTLADQAATASCPVTLTAGVLGLDVTGLTDFGTTAGVDLDTDTLIVSDGPGTNKEILASQLVTPEVDGTIATTTDTLDETNFGKITPYSNAAVTVTLPNGLKAGYWATLLYTGTGALTLSATTTLNTPNSFTQCATQYGAVTVFHAGSNVWYAWGELNA